MVRCKCKIQCFKGSNWYCQWYFWALIYPTLCYWLLFLFQQFGQVDHITGLVYSVQVCSVLCHFYCDVGLVIRYLQTGRVTSLFIKHVQILRYFIWLDESHGTLDFKECQRGSLKWPFAEGTHVGITRVTSQPDQCNRMRGIFYDVFVGRPGNFRVIYESLELRLSLIFNPIKLIFIGCGSYNYVFYHITSISITESWHTVK